MIGIESASTVADLGRALLADLAGLTDRLVEAIVVEDPSYAVLGAIPDDDLRVSCAENLRRVLEVLIGEPSDADPFDAPRETGRRRAEQAVPLESVLHAYRLGHRVIWEALVTRARRGDAGVEPLVDAASEVWAVVDRFSSAVADAYRTTAADLARRDAGRREALLDALLEGRPADRATLAAASSALDLPETGRFVVAVIDGGRHGRPAADALRVRGFRTSWRARADTEIALVLLGPATARDLAAAMRGVPGVRAGLSPTVDALAEVATAYRLATTALHALPAHGPAVLELDARLPAALLVSAPDLAQRLVTRALGPVLALPAEERDLLLTTLAAWLASDGSAGRTAVALYCHRNTVLNRLRRLEALTGRSTERVDDLVAWSLALAAREVLPTR